ncbi:hypothetical protein MKEN_00560100 [Mycena kentingensis (nom. inval.)]|nr:hypothetical protein MKEN_00560100 [Mycena kentingensis (nom. inval.)]
MSASCYFGQSSGSASAEPEPLPQNVGLLVLYPTGALNRRYQDAERRQTPETNIGAGRWWMRGMAPPLPAPAIPPRYADAVRPRDVGYLRRQLQLPSRIQPRMSGATDAMHPLLALTSWFLYSVVATGAQAMVNRVVDTLAPIAQLDPTPAAAHAQSAASMHFTGQRLAPSTIAGVIFLSLLFVGLQVALFCLWSKRRAATKDDNDDASLHTKVKITYPIAARGRRAPSARAGTRIPLVETSH